MGRPNRAVQAAIAQRCSDAVNLRVAGVGWSAIGRKLAADPSTNSDGLAYPQGCGIGHYRQGLAPPSDTRLIERPERLFFPMFQWAVRSGDYWATDRAAAGRTPGGCTRDRDGVAAMSDGRKGLMIHGFVNSGFYVLSWVC
ncbi:hypothetical protein ABZ543_29810 [Streptomyces roseifaciens]